MKHLIHFALSNRNAYARDACLKGTELKERERADSGRDIPSLVVSFPCALTHCRSCENVSLLLCVVLAEMVHKTHKTTYTYVLYSMPLKIARYPVQMLLFIENIIL